MTGQISRLGIRFLRGRWRVLVRLGGWSVLETGQTFLTGYAPARALDEGFLAGRPEAGLGWLAVAGLGVVLGAYGTARVYAAVAALVEPLRDRLVARVVARGVREADGGALSGLTQQVEIARDTFAGLVMVSRSFLFTAVGALVGLFSLDPLLLLVVGPPLLAGVALFAATLRPLARRQEAFLVADEALADDLGAVCPGLRDITAAGRGGTGRHRHRAPDRRGVPDRPVPRPLERPARGLPRGRRPTPDRPAPRRGTLAPRPRSHHGRSGRRPRLRHPVPAPRPAQPGPRPGHERLTARGGAAAAGA